MFFKFIITKSRGILRLYDLILQIQFQFIFDLMLTRPFDYLGGNALYKHVVCIVELHRTKVHAALRMVEIQNIQVHHEY